MIEQQLKMKENEIAMGRNVCNKCVNDISVPGILFNGNNC